jgi:hypothetical protein
MNHARAGQKSNINKCCPLRQPFQSFKQWCDSYKWQRTIKFMNQQKQGYNSSAHFSAIAFLSRVQTHVICHTIATAVTYNLCLWSSETGLISRLRKMLVNSEKTCSKCVFYRLRLRTLRTNVVICSVKLRPEVFSAVTVKNAALWDMTLCGYCKSRRFGGKYRLYH